LHRLVRAQCDVYLVKMQCFHASSIVHISGISRRLAVLSTTIGLLLGCGGVQEDSNVEVVHSNTPARAESMIGSADSPVLIEYWLDFQ